MTAEISLDVLDLRAWVEPGQLEPGSAAVLVVEATMAEGAHIEAHEPPEPFLVPTVLDVEAGQGLAAGPVAYPRPEVRKLDWAPAELLVLAGTARFTAPIRVDAGAPAGRATLKARLRYQACIDGACLPPADRTITATLDIVEADGSVVAPGGERMGESVGVSGGQATLRG